MVDRRMTAPMFGDSAMEGIWSDRALIAAMLAVETALARVQGDLGLIPDGTAAALDAALQDWAPDPVELAAGVAEAGVVVPALVQILRAKLDDPAADWIHFGATSQDILDTAMILCLSKALDRLGSRLAEQITRLERLARAHVETVMAGRTRGQLATPIPFGLRVANWAQPLIALEADLADLRARALRVQFGGASGAQSALSPHGPAVSAGLAAALGLRDGPPWHSDRTPFADAAHWLGRLSAAQAKLARDLGLMSRNEIAEARAGAAGGSSTMPHKANPVTAEAILACNNLALGAKWALDAAAAHTEERDGAHWAVEWRALPDLCVTVAAALGHGCRLVETLEVDVEAMGARLAAAPEIFAEAAVFGLAPLVGRAAAQALVKAALRDPRPFQTALEAGCAGIEGLEGMDLETILDPRHVIAPAKQVIDQIFEARR